MKELPRILDYDKRISVALRASGINLNSSEVERVLNIVEYLDAYKYDEVSIMDVIQLNIKIDKMLEREIKINKT